MLITSPLALLPLLTPSPACRTPAARACAEPPRSSQEYGKFQRHNELEPGCAPLGVLCGGFDEDQLEGIAEVIESVFETPDGPGPHVPIVPLAQGDMRLRLRDVLAKLNERDSIVPAQPVQLRVPLVLVSGFNPVQTSLAVRQIRGLGLRGGVAAQPAGFRWPWEQAPKVADPSSMSPPMFAAAVPKALDKSLSVLCDELEGDYLANAR